MIKFTLVKITDYLSTREQTRKEAFEKPVESKEYRKRLYDQGVKPKVLSNLVNWSCFETLHLTPESW